MSTHTVTESELVKFSEDLRNAANNLKIACMSLRSCYVTNASSVQEFVALRRKITNHATVYSRVILPSANVVVQNIQDFVETYTALSYDDFKECIEDLANGAHRNQDMASYTKLLHQEILANFKNEENNVNIVLKKLEKDTEWYKARAKQLRELSNVKTSWAIGLSLIPGVNFIASPILWYSGKEDLVEAIASEEESKLAVAATFIIRDVLQTSLLNFAQALADISGFFNILQNELSILARNSDDGVTKLHYYKCRNKVPAIVAACHFYMKSIPDCQTDLMTIPNDIDKNYVQQWLLEKKARIGNINLSFLEMGRNLFNSNAQFVRLLENV
ncbi:16092_t:CDS:1 [Funneliformis geosporum]|uniref:18967_t:CDS:1 n=1 Tax=Funneliformis geosporum TaxID=1117311 RepID=A0A9W4SGM5_9GLOM|nr:18967_t:CDS:1 [Funneliformis geosporum]CAI2175712.1 16092_t:CDS:1 [Funneliformis geosporum]